MMPSLAFVTWSACTLECTHVPHEFIIACICIFVYTCVRVCMCMFALISVYKHVDVNAYMHACSHDLSHTQHACMHAHTIQYGREGGEMACGHVPCAVETVLGS